MSEELTKKTKTKRRIKQTKDPAQAGSSYSLQRTSVQEKQADQFKEEVEYVDHKDTENLKLYIQKNFKWIDDDVINAVCKKLIG